MFTPAHRGGAGAPLLLLHGFLDTWRTWELVLPALERRHEVLAPTLPGHAGGPAFPGSADAVLDALETRLDEAGWATAHIAGNSLGGWLALRLAERGRARSVVALAPAGGWADESYRDTLATQRRIHRALREGPAPELLVATDEGRRRATRLVTVAYEHIPEELIAHQLRGVAAADLEPMLEHALAHGWPLAPERVACPVRIVWGAEDELLPWPEAAQLLRGTFPHADWVVLDGVGHSPQLDRPLETAELILGWTAD
jgi:pimeloyl-ACP methyl ester carboxylesterase